MKLIFFASYYFWTSKISDIIFMTGKINRDKEKELQNKETFCYYLVILCACQYWSHFLVLATFTISFRASVQPFTRFGEGSDNKKWIRKMNYLLLNFNPIVCKYYLFNSDVFRGPRFIYSHTKDPCKLLQKGKSRVESLHALN